MAPDTVPIMPDGEVSIALISKSNTVEFSILFNIGFFSFHMFSKNNENRNVFHNFGKEKIYSKLN